MKNVACSVCLVSVLLLAAGCGKNVNLSGKITFSDDGTPLSAGSVCFEAEDGSISRGEINPDGTYVVGTLASKDGLPPGPYKVYITGSIKEIGRDARRVPITEPLIDTKYASPAFSELSFEVGRGKTRFDFQVDRYRAGAPGGGR